LQLEPFQQIAALQLSPKVQQELMLFVDELLEPHSVQL
jgi:hypothetical protein